ncbi:MAG: beta-ketoacyl-ACP synthase III [Clostridia bacterium]
MNIEIIGSGWYTPPNPIDNFDLSKLVDTSNDWIISRTGIYKRNISLGENTSEMAVKAATDAIKSAKIDPKEIDLIVVATITPDKFTPSTACLIQEELGAKNAFAFDLSAGCTGFIYALNTAHSFIATKKVKTALVVGAEVLSKVLNWKDRNTCILFGDGAGAVVVKRNDKKEFYAYCASSGDPNEVLQLDAVAVNNPYTKTTESKQYLTMKGQEVFQFAVGAIRKSIKKLMKQTDLELKDVKYIIPHQANARIVDFVARKMDYPVERFYLNLDRNGNTSAASIPIALAEMVEKGLLVSGDKVIMVGFGGGLTWGAILIEI